MPGVDGYIPFPEPLNNKERNMIQIQTISPNDTLLFDPFRKEPQNPFV
jgi:hypothetical protein